MGAQTKSMNTIASKEKRDEGEIMACSKEISVFLVVSCHQKTFKHAFYIYLFAQISVEKMNSQMINSGSLKLHNNDGNGSSPTDLRCCSAPTAHSTLA